MNVKEFALQKRQERKGIKKVQKILCGIELSTLAVPFDNKWTIIKFTLNKSNYFCTVRLGNSFSK